MLSREVDLLFVGFFNLNQYHTISAFSAILPRSEFGEVTLVKAIFTDHMV